MPKKIKRLTMSEATRKLKVTRQAVLWAIKNGKLKGKRIKINIPTTVWMVDAESVKKYKVSKSHRKRGLKNR